MSAVYGAAFTLVAVCVVAAVPMALILGPLSDRMPGNVAGVIFFLLVALVLECAVALGIFVWLAPLIADLWGAPW